MTCSGRRRSSSRVSTLKAGRLSVRGTAAIRLSLCTSRRQEAGSVSLRRSTHLKMSSSCKCMITACSECRTPAGQSMGATNSNMVLPFRLWAACVPLQASPRVCLKAGTFAPSDEDSSLTRSLARTASSCSRSLFCKKRAQSLDAAYIYSSLGCAHLMKIILFTLRSDNPWRDSMLCIPYCTTRYIEASLRYLYSNISIDCDFIC